MVIEFILKIVNLSASCNLGKLYILMTINIPNEILAILEDHHEIKVEFMVIVTSLMARDLKLIHPEINYESSLKMRRESRPTK